LIQLNADMLHV